MCIMSWLKLCLFSERLANLVAYAVLREEEKLIVSFQKRKEREKKLIKKPFGGKKEREKKE